MAWSKWNAPSDYDYYDQFRNSGIERSCTDCGNPVMVDRGEGYELQVFCDACLEKAERRKALKATIDLARAKRGAA